MSDQNTAIKVEHVSKNFVLPHERKTSIKSVFTNVFGGKATYSKQVALKDINLDVKEGEFFGIVGRNGSGKSTLLKIIAGIYQPTKGSVKINGKLVPFIELGVGFNPELSGRENVYLNGAILGFTRKEIQQNYKEIVEFAELEQFMDQKLKNYSSGMQVRLAFACATKAKAEVLLVDEVLAVGDSDFQRKCFNYFKLLKKEKKTVVFVSHDMGAVREYCDRAVLIDSNHIIAEGSADDVATEYTKLFNSPQSISGNDNNNANRWGDGKIKFEKVEAKVNDKNLILTADAKVYGQVEDVVFGYLIKDSAGNPLFGSNSHVKNIKTGVFSPGDTKKITWTIPNIFDDGIFVITLAISQNDGVSQHDWWEDAASFTVFKENKTPYALDPPSTITVS